MGGAEFADQAVLFTEDQTWGLTNIDLDVPQLYPIHPGVGCVAPDSIATGDGAIMWAAKDGIYLWDGGSKAPEKVSWNWEETFGKMSFDTHGGSRGVIHNYNYDIRLANPTYTTTHGLFRFNLLTKQWSTITHNAGIAEDLYPFGPISGPLGSEDPGVVHPVYAKGDYATPSASFSLYLGEMTTQDNGTNYTCYAVMHFPLAPGGTFVPSRALAYYQADTGWQTPSITFESGTNIIGDPLGTVTTGTPDTGADYSVVAGTFSQPGTGTSDLQIRFSATTQSGGTVGHQRLFGGVIEGRKGRVRLGSI